MSSEVLIFIVHETFNSQVLIGDEAIIDMRGPYLHVRGSIKFGMRSTPRKNNVTVDFLSRRDSLKKAITRSKRSIDAITFTEVFVRKSYKTHDLSIYLTKLHLDS